MTICAPGVGRHPDRRCGRSKGFPDANQCPHSLRPSPNLHCPPVRHLPELLRMERSQERRKDLSDLIKHG